MVLLAIIIYALSYGTSAWGTDRNEPTATAPLHISVPPIQSSSDEVETPRQADAVRNNRTLAHFRKKNFHSSPTTLSDVSVEILEARNATVKKWSLSLMRSQFTWDFSARVCETASQICQVGTIIVSTLSASYSNGSMALASACIASCGLGLSQFAKYSSKESVHRGDAANRYLAQEGVPPIVVINDDVQVM